MNEKALSVIVPAYNVKEYIADCLNSIVSQIYSNIEVVVVDDGSTDGTSEICEKFAQVDNRVIYMRQNNAGVTAARLKGAEIATGKYVTFVDADDYIDPNMFEVLMDKINNFDVICSGVVRCEQGIESFCDFEGEYITIDEMQKIWGKMIYDFRQNKCNVVLPSMCAKVFKRELTLDILRSMDKNIVYGEDAVLVYEYLLKCKSAYFVKEAFYHYRYREDSVVHSTNDKMLENVNRIYKELKPVFDCHPMKKSLNMQLEKWSMRMIISAVNKFMGFAQDNRMIRFIVSTEEYVDKRVVLYGAGEMGKDIALLLRRSGIEHVAWIDRAYEEYQNQGLEVETPAVLKSMEFDVVLIAVSEERVAEDIRRNMIDIGVAEEKIMWKKPTVLV